MTDATIADVLEGRAQWCVAQGEAIDILRALPLGSIDALVCDPPYSSGGFVRGDRMGSVQDKYIRSGASEEYLEAAAGFTGDNRDQRGFAFWCSVWLGLARLAMADGAPVVQFTDWRQLPITTDVLQAGGFIWRGVFVWDKGDGGRPQLGRFRASSEFGVWGSNGPMPMEGECLPGSFRTSAPPNKERIHATQKPLDLMRTVVRVCKPGGIILDPFCGSGTTGAAAVLEGRRFIGIDLDHGHASNARKRIEADLTHTTIHAKRAGQTGLFVEGKS